MAKGRKTRSQWGVQRAQRPRQLWGFRPAGLGDTRRERSEGPGDSRLSEAGPIWDKTPMGGDAGTPAFGT